MGKNHGNMQKTERSNCLERCAFCFHPKNASNMDKTYWMIPFNRCYNGNGLFTIKEEVHYVL